MKIKIIRIILIMEDGIKITIRPNKIIKDVEAYRNLPKEANNASKVFFVMEETD